MPQCRRRLGIMLVLSAVCLSALFGCGANRDAHGASADTYVLSDAVQGEQIPWDTVLQFAESGSDARVTRAAVNREGQALTAEYDVETDDAGVFVHTPFGGIFEADVAADTVRIRYSLTCGDADAPKTVTVCSAFPDFQNSGIAQLLTAARTCGCSTAVTGGTPSSSYGATCGACICNAQCRMRTAGVS